MRFRFLAALIFTLVFVLAFQQVTAVCRIPVHYHLGALDDRFGLTTEEVLEVTAYAEALWEDAIGRDLFQYHEERGLVINFIYDERQQNTEAEQGFRERLDSVQNMNTEIRAQYERLLEEYESLVDRYEARVAAYETRLVTYNVAVSELNQQGGAPPETVETLERERKALRAEQEEIQQQAGELDGVVEGLNQLGRQGNVLVEEYNHGVGEYNQTFGQTREFTHGDFRGKEINIYAFANKNELALILAHELGHALGIGHVEGQESIMHYLIGEQPETLTLSPYDQAAFTSVCTETSLWDRMTSKVRRY